MKNKFIVIESGQLTIYLLDDKLQWELGRVSKENVPDIQLHSVTVSRRHGEFQNHQGIWFYVDNYGKNGTVLNGKHLHSGIGGRRVPHLLKSGDTFVFGGGEKEVISYKTVWGMFTTKEIDDQWLIVDTKDYSELEFSDGISRQSYSNPARGLVVEQENGMAIYMGNITYCSGKMNVTGK